ncbi:MAG: NusG domain II-containing protein [Lachnospiraceae bacterium]|nr:NusG domain II-containing protein [Lachnospiraceae bacterium]
MNKTFRNECILVGGILAFAILMWGVITYVQNVGTRNAQAVIMVDGQEVGRYSLSGNREVPIKGVKGGKNVLVIHDGKAKMKSASCPDKICVHHKAVSKNGQTIVCLPNKVVIEIQSGEESGVDGATN